LNRGKLGKDTEGVKSHSSIIAETPMINNHHYSKPKVSGLISQLNSTAEEQYLNVMINRTNQSQPGMSFSLINQSSRV